MKYISVIIPTYNRASYILESIESVLAQDFGKYNYEILVIDDGSTDNTEEVLKKFKDKITYVKLPHSGKPAVPRNYGISIAKGDLIAFQDSDDIWPKNKLKDQLLLFEDKDIVMSYGRALTMNSEGMVSKNQLVKDDILDNGTDFAKLLKANSISTLTVVAKKEAILSVGGFDESDKLRAVEDYQLWLKILAKYPDKIKFIDKVLAYYRQHEDNISKASSLLAIDRIINVLSSIWTHDLTIKQRKSLEKALFDYHTGHRRLTIEDGDQPLISVIMGVYNGEEFFDDSINSILNQTYSNFEFIIVNDGSKKPAVDAISKYTDKRIRVVHQNNKGHAGALNTGISLATGKFIARQDSDDISLPTRLEKELQLLVSSENIGVVGTFFTYVDEETLEPSITMTQPHKKIDVKRSMLVHNPLGHGTTMFKKEIFEKIEPYTNKLGPIEDFELWLRIADKYELAVVPENLYLYRLNTKGMSSLGGQTQIKVTKDLIKKQWKKPFPLKSYKDIVRDGYFYKNLNSPFADQMYDQYINQNIELAKGCLNNGWLKRGVLISKAVRKLEPAKYKELRKPIIKCTLDKALFKKG